MKTARILFIAILLLGVHELYAQGSKAKPRVIVMTDGEIDDHSSMIRFLLYSGDVAVLAIIETNSMFQESGHSHEDWYEQQLEAYQRVYPNLIKHNPDYPTYEKLKSISFIGDEDSDHLKGLRDIKKNLVPGYKVTFKPDDWADTPGSDAIVNILLERDPSPVFIQAWGGGNTAARAFYKLKTKYPEQYDRTVAKVVMYNIWYQDGGGNYIEQAHPLVTMLYCASFAGTWNYKSQPDTHDFIKNHVKNDHGPLGSLYPQEYVSEGDSPAFLYSIKNGLRGYENPAYGGWGGRFEKSNQGENVYTDAQDDGDVKKPFKRWIEEANADFQARMDWCVAKNYEEANHAPLVVVKGKKNVTAKSGEKITLNASKSADPDGNDLQFHWWQYQEAGSYDGWVELQGSESANAYFAAPVVSRPETIHVILSVADDGNPVLHAYERFTTVHFWT